MKLIKEINILGLYFKLSGWLALSCGDKSQRDDFAFNLLKGIREIDILEDKLELL